MKIQAVYSIIFLLVVCSIQFCSAGLRSRISKFLHNKLDRSTTRDRILTTSKINRIIISKSFNKLYLHHTTGQSIALSVSKNGLEVHNLENNTGEATMMNNSRDIFHAVFGIYKLPAGHFIAIVKKSKEGFDFPLPGIRKVSKIELLKIPSTVPRPQYYNATAIAELQDQAELLLLETFKQHSFYYSIGDYDISRTYQSNIVSKQQNQYDSISISSSINNHAHTADERFFWNLNSVKPLIDANSSAFVTPMVNAWISSANISDTYGTPYVFTLISRRSRRNQGPRYIKRGGDSFSDVANFVETEQILHSLDGNATSSFVQLRGSVPLLWTQPSDWQLRPSVHLPTTTIHSLLQHATVLRTHILDLACAYFTDTWWIEKQSSSSEKGLKHPTVSTTSSSNNTIHMINLIDKKGTQLELGHLLLKTWKILMKTGVEKVLALPILRKYGETCQFIDEKNGINQVEQQSDEEVMSILTLNGTIEQNETVLDRNDIIVDNITVHLTPADVTGMYNIDNFTTSTTCTTSTTTTSTISPTVRTIDYDSSSMPITAQHLWFDYHHKCKHYPTAVCEIFPYLHSAIGSKDGMFTSTQSTSLDVVPNDRHVYSQQRHLIRTNCMDCLDRTNVVQSVISRWVLARQLVILQQIHMNRKIPVSELLVRSPIIQLADQDQSLALGNQTMEAEFRRLWTENGDYLSLLYAGSRAMKRDVTHSGVRTHRGAVDDAMAAALRYWNNNLRDVRRQHGINVLLGLAHYEDNAHLQQKENIQVNGELGNVMKDHTVLSQYAPLEYRQERVRRILSLFPRRFQTIVRRFSKNKHHINKTKERVIGVKHEKSSGNIENKVYESEEDKNSSDDLDSIMNRIVIEVNKMLF